MGFWKDMFGSKPAPQSQAAFHIGDRVRFKNDGPIIAQTEDTGHREPVLLEQKGREGTIVALSGDGVPVGIPVVKWDSGDYRVHAGTDHADNKVWYKGTVHLNAFQCGINSDWIEPSSATPGGASAGANAYTHIDLLNADPSKFECERCHKTKPHQRVSDQYAGDLWICASCGYKTARSKGL